MDFTQLAKTRYSVRSYDKRPIEDEKLTAILEAGRVAPTACNNQPQRIYVVKSEENREKLASVCRFTFGAPVILVIAYNKDEDWKNRHMQGYGSGETDAAIVCTHLMLKAWEEGIGSCWVGCFNAEDISKVLSLPENERVCALLPIGYPAADAEPAPMHEACRPLCEIVREL